MTPEQRRSFEEQGYTLLAGAVPRAQLSPLREHIVKELKRLGVAAGRQGIPKSIAALPAFQQIVKLSALVGAPDLEAKVVSPTLRAAVEILTSRGALTVQSQLLLSPPQQGAWTLDGCNWHTDAARSSRVAPLQAFILIDDVAPRGGGTLILAGSHLPRGDKQAEAHLRQTLGKGQEGEPELRRQGLSIVELTGKAGDVYLMDMRVLHTPSINSTKRIRMVATLRYFAA